MGHLDQWAKDNGLNAEEQAAMEKLLGEDRSKKAAGYGLRQDAFDRKMNEEKAVLDAQRRKLDESSANLESLMRTTAEIQDEAKRDGTRISAENKKLIEKAAKLEASVRKQAMDAGLDPDEVIKQIGVDAAVAEPRREETPLEPKVDLGKRFLEERVKTLFTDAELADIADEHKELTGKRLSRKEVIEYALEQAKRGRDMTPTQAWEELHKIPELRATKNEESVNARIEAARQDGLTRGRTEAAMARGGDPASGAQVMSPALKLPRMGEDGKPAAQPEHLRRAAETIAKVAAGVQ